MEFKKCSRKFHSHLRGGTQITRVLGIPGGHPGIPKTRQPYLEGIPILTRDLGMGIPKTWGYPTVTADRHFEGTGDEVATHKTQQGLGTKQEPYRK